MNCGLPVETIEGIVAVLVRHPGVEKAILYGSRAKGNYKPGSDIDLALLGQSLDMAELARIEDEIDDLSFPYTMDMAIYSQIDNQNLIDHIDRVGVPLYTRNNRVP
jgi:predicted nucleotidyltransferase